VLSGCAFFPENTMRIGSVAVVRVLVALGMGIVLLPRTTSAAEVAAGEEVVLQQPAPLMLGRETLMTIEKGTKLTIRKVNGSFLQVAVSLDDEETWGWIHSRCLEADPAVTPDDSPNTSNGYATSNKSSKTFSAAEINALRQKAQEVTNVPEQTPDGWSKSLVDPMDLVALFQPLQVKQGYRLRAYQFMEDMNGNGAVWAMPVDARFPEPAELLEANTSLFRAPRPGKALDNVMEAVEGDRSARSFLLASILKRELDEFGAMWHGCSWTAHQILDADPWQGPAPSEEDNPMDHPSWPASKWKWKTNKPLDWRPSVTVNGHVTRVKFYTFCAIGKEGIYEHIDEYRPGEYRFTTERRKIAEGPMELAF
jgi:hypothetical protein